MNTNTMISASRITTCIIVDRPAGSSIEGYRHLDFVEIGVPVDVSGGLVSELSAISSGRIATSTEAWATSPAVMALTDSEWGVLASLHFFGDDVRLEVLSPRVVAAYLSDPAVTQPPTKMPRLMLRVTRCADPAAWHAGKVGELVTFVCAGVGCWMARDDAGTLQRIDLEDADLVEVRGGVVSSIVS